MTDIKQQTTEVADLDMLKETVYPDEKCPACKKNTLRQSEHSGLVSEKCSNEACKHSDMYSR